MYAKSADVEAKMSACAEPCFCLSLGDWVDTGLINTNYLHRWFALPASDAAFFDFLASFSICN